MLSKVICVWIICWKNWSHLLIQLEARPKLLVTRANFSALAPFACNYFIRPFYSSQRHIRYATAHTWERGWGWLVLNLCERFWWNSYLGSKIVRFLRKMDGPSRNLDKANFSPKKKGKQCAAFGCSNTFYGPNGLPTSFHFFKFMHRGMYFC